MPITILYCADCTPPTLLAAGDCAGAMHEHEDGSQHPATAISGVGEAVPDELPHTMSDGTIVHTYPDWLAALEEYLP